MPSLPWSRRSVLCAAALGPLAVWPRSAAGPVLVMRHAQTDPGIGDPSGFALWVTHQVNISALAGRFAAMGQALWVGRRADGSVVATPFD